MADRVGQRFGDYRLIRFLGEGTFGDVYLGEHVYQKAPAAVKVFKTKLTPDKFKDFINEVRTVLLRHPNIVPIIDFGVGENDIAYLVMEYAPNGTLLQRHPRRTRLPLATVVTYVKQIAAALQYAHDQRRIHRDVKPENMLFGANNEILLSDFGIAVVAHNPDSQRTEDSIGTARYMAPEQWRGKPVTATDQYALGIIVYEWLCGECPFEGIMSHLMHQHIYDPPPPLREKVPTISPEVEQVVMTALAKDPKQRFASVRAFANALEQAYKAKPPVGATLLTYRGHVGGASVVAWSPDGKRIVSGTSEGMVQVWDAFMGSNIFTYRGHSRGVSTVVWSPDGRRIASAGVDMTVQVWDATTRSTLLTYCGHAQAVRTIAWSPDGMYIASNAENVDIQVWDASTGTRILTCHGDYTSQDKVVWSPDSIYIAIANGRVEVWNVKTKKCVTTYRSWCGLRAVAWSPDGRFIAIGGDDCIPHVLKVDLTQDVVSIPNPYPPGTIVADYAVWDYLSWSPDSSYIVSSCEYGGRFVENVVIGKTVPIICGDYSPPVWSPDSKQFAVGVNIISSATGEIIYTYRGHSGRVNAVAWSPDGTRIASAGSDGVHIWQAV